MKPRVSLGALLFLLLCTPLARGQIVMYSFTGGTGAATSLDSHLNASAFAGSNSPTISTTTPFSAGSGSHSIFQSGWTGATPGTNYFEFTLTPVSGFEASLTSVSFGSRSTMSGPTNYYVRSSADNYASNLVSSSLTNDGNWYSSGAQSITLSFTSATTFRLYANGANSSSGTLRVDDFGLSGSVSAVPEPSTYAAMAGAAAFLVAIWRRRNANRARAA